MTAGDGQAAQEGGDRPTVRQAVGRRILSAAVVGGAIAGAIDLTYVCALWSLRGVSPMRILQSIASGVLGKAATAGGWKTAALGGVLHFSMTFAMSLMFATAYALLPPLRRGVASWGLAYGAWIFLVMNYVVVPLSNARGAGLPPLDRYLMGLTVHILGVGLPIALTARAYLGPRARS